jgi:hypothetical protein
MSKPLIGIIFDPTQSYGVIDKKTVETQLPSANISFNTICGNRSNLQINTFELFRKAQEKLCHIYDVLECSIRGSAVTQLFTQEQISDIDFHVEIDLSRIDEKQLITVGNSFKWEILKTIQEIVNSHFASTVINSLEDILFQERHVLGFLRGWSTFNIHTLRLGQNPPIEFTFRAVVRKDDSKERLFDFNISSLKLLWDEGKDELTLHSLLPDLKRIIQQIKEKSLFCPEAELVKRKPIAKYLFKLVRGGYHDGDPKLLDKFLENSKLVYKEGENSQVTQKVIQEINKHFFERTIDLTVPLLQLYFTDPNGSYQLKALQSDSCKALLNHLDCVEAVTSQNMSRFIKTQAKAELAWYLVCFSTEINHVTHRSKECFKIKIPLNVLKNKGLEGTDSFYLLIPISLLWQLKDLTYPMLFANICEEESWFETYSEKATTTLRGMLSNLLSKPSISIVLLTVLKRLKIAPNKHSVHLLLHEIPNLNELFHEGVSITNILLLLKGIDNLKDLSLPLETILIVMRQVLVNIAANQLSELENTLSYPFFTHFALELLRNHEKGFSQVLYRKSIIAYLCEYQKCALIEGSDFSKIEIVKQKKILDLSFLLLNKGYLNTENSFFLFNYCLKAGLSKQAGLILKSIITLKRQIDEKDIIQTLEVFIKSSFSDCLDFLILNKSILKQNVSNFDLLFVSLFLEIDSLKSVCEYTKIFIDLFDYFYDKNPSWDVKFFIFQRAALYDPFFTSIFEYFISNKILTLSELKNAHSLNTAEIIFLLDLENLINELIDDPDFRNFIIYTALKHNLHRSLLGLLNNLYNSKSDLELQPNIFKVLALIGREHELFMDCLKMFWIVSEKYDQSANCCEFVRPMLDSLALFLNKDDSSMLYLTIKEDMLCLSDFHQKFAIKTIDHLAWNLLWAKLSICETKYSALDWLEIEDLNKLIQLPSSLEYLQNFAQAFSSNHFLICHIFEVISSFDAEKQKKFWPLIFNLLHDKFFFLFIDNFETNLKQQNAALFAITLAGQYIEELNPDNTSIDEVKNLLTLLLFSVTFGSNNVREGAFDFFCNLLTYDKTTFVAMLKSTGIDEEIIFTKADLALREKDYERLKKINDLISNRYIDIQACGNSFSTFKLSYLFTVPDLLKWRLEYWMRSFKDIFQKGSESLNAKKDNSPLAALNYFSRFSTIIIISINYALKSKLVNNDEFIKIIQKSSFQTLLRLIDFFSTKKFIRSSIAFIHMISLVGYLTKEQALEFVGKFINYATKQINALEPCSGLNEDQMIARHLFSQTAGYFIHLRNHFKLKKEADANFILPLLIAARSRLNCFNQEHLIDSNLINTLSSLQMKMDEKELQNYHRTWLNEIVVNRETVSFDELTLFAIFTFRATSKFASAFTSIGPDRNLPQISFVEKEYFSPSIIKNFIRLFDILFTRFPDRIQPMIGNPREMDLDAFSLLPAYKSNIDWGLIQMKGSSDCEKIKIDFLDILFKAMRYENNSLMLAVIQAAIRYLVRLNEEGSIDFHIKAKSHMPKNAAIFYRLIIFLNSLPECLFQDIAIMLHQLVSLYEGNQGLFNKELTAEQNESIVVILRDKLSQEVTENVSQATYQPSGEEHESYLDLNFSFKCDTIWSEIDPKE